MRRWRRLTMIIRQRARTCAPAIAKAKGMYPRCKNMPVGNLKRSGRKTWEMTLCASEAVILPR